MIEEKAPYMVINYTVKGNVNDYDWNKLAEWAEFEKILFVHEITPEIFNDAHVIIDVLNGKIKKTVLINHIDQIVIEHYLKNYESNVIAHVRKFFKLYPEAWASLVKTVNEVVEKLDSTQPTSQEQSE